MFLSWLKFDIPCGAKNVLNIHMRYAAELLTIFKIFSLLHSVVNLQYSDH